MNPVSSRTRAAAALVAVAAVLAACGTGSSTTTPVDGTASGAPAASTTAFPLPPDASGGATVSRFCTGECAAALALTADPAEIACKVGLSWNSAKHPYGAKTTTLTPEFAKANFPKMEVFVADGRGDAATQTGQVDDLIARGIDVLIISPADAAALAGAVDRATAAGIKVIASDRSVDTAVSSYIGADNVDGGVIAGKKAVELLGGKGNVVELAGSLGASPTIDRGNGFRQGIEGSGVELIDSQSGDYDRAKGLKVMEDLLQKYGAGKIDLVFTHNDQMAFGAIQAIKEAGRQDEIKVIGYDSEVGAIEAILAGDMAATPAYPLTFREHTIAAAKLCAGENIPERIKMDATIIDKDNALQLGAGQ